MMQPLNAPEPSKGSIDLISAETKATPLTRKIAGRRFVNILKSRTPNDEAKALTQADVNELLDECLSH